MWRFIFLHIWKSASDCFLCDLIAFSTFILVIYIWWSGKWFLELKSKLLVIYPAVTFYHVFHGQTCGYTFSPIGGSLSNVTELKLSYWSLNRCIVLLYGITFQRNYVFVACPWYWDFAFSASVACALGKALITPLCSYLFLEEINKNTHQVDMNNWNLLHYFISQWFWSVHQGKLW